jgi:cyclic-di-GMP phosphodiesterase TipF (flagellum assembly factor)
LLAAGIIAAAPAPEGRPDSSAQNELPFAKQGAAPAGGKPAHIAASTPAPSAAPAPKPAPAAVAAEPSRAPPQVLASIRSAIEENRLDIYLQPMVTLPQRKVRFYEAVTRLRDEKDEVIAADDFIGIAEAGGLIGRIDHMVMLRCVQVLRRLMVRVAGDTLALTPPLIITEEQIGEVIDKVAKVIRATA